MSTLKQNDIAVLSYIFDPNITGNYDIFQTNEDINVQPELVEVESESEASKEATRLELAGVKCAEAGKVKEAVDYFSKSLELVDRASGYNNRAQAYRLLADDTAALRDLDKAIALSEGKGRAGMQALCQRGSLYRKLARDDEAKQDFTRAAALGSAFAKKQLVEMNPYAAMCNQMLHQMMFKQS